MFQRNIDKMVSEQVFKSSVMEDQSQPTATAVLGAAAMTPEHVGLLKHMLSQTGEGLTVRQARKRMASFGYRLTDQEVLRLYVS